jgi:predicted ester cyclase
VAVDPFGHLSVSVGPRGAHVAHPAQSRLDVRLAATRHADWAGVPTTSQTIDTIVGCLYEFDEGQLVCERVYLDFAEIARQLGPAT